MFHTDHETPSFKTKGFKSVKPCFSKCTLEKLKKQNSPKLHALLFVLFTSCLPFPCAVYPFYQRCHSPPPLGFVTIKTVIMMGLSILPLFFFFFHVNPLVHVYGASSLLSLQPLFTCWLPMIAQFDAHRAFSFVYFCSPFFTHASLQHKTLLLWLYAELHNYSTRFFLVMFSQEKKKAKYQLLCSHNNITTPSFSRFLPLYHLFVKTNKKHNCFFFLFILLSHKAPTLVVADILA